MRSSLFLNNVTVVDHAYITPEGTIRGGSVNPSFIISGEVENHEQVVIDFSKCKKMVKQIIDDEMIGFDHKLWVIPSSDCKLTQVNPLRSQLESNFLKFEMPTCRFKVVDSSYKDYECWPIWMGELVEAVLRKEFPSISVRCFANDAQGAGFTPFPSSFDSVVMPFRYTHGLKNSSSWGCRNAGHGHLSYIQAIPATKEVQDVVEMIRKEVDNAVFIFNENIESSDGVSVALRYLDEEGIEFKAEYVVDTPTSLQILYFMEQETTIENIVDHIVHKFYSELIESGCETLFISEGLWKGACWQR